MAVRTKESVETTSKETELVSDDTTPEIGLSSDQVVEEGEGQPSISNVTSETKVASAKTRMYLLSALTKDASAALAELTALVLTVGSKVEKAEDLGLKRLAFPINQQRELSLVSLFFNADGQTIQTLNNELRHLEIIERYLLSTWRAGLEEPKRRQAERQKREAEKNV